jgi:hypothetical protein
MRYSLYASLSLVPVLVAMPAHGHDVYPKRIKSDLGLSYEPSCQICHRGVEGSKSAVQPFVRVLEQFGLPSSVDVTTLSAVLEEDEACHVDSDGDGVTDIAELRAGGNPSDGTGAPTLDCGDGGGPVLTLTNAPPFQTGCAFSSGRLNRHPRWSLFGLAILSLGLWRRRSSRLRHR